MSNLYKYIQIINESDDLGKAQLYEKYIYLGFKYLKQKSDDILLGKTDIVNIKNKLEVQLSRVTIDYKDSNNIGGEQPKEQIKKPLEELKDLLTKYKDRKNSKIISNSEQKALKQQAIEDIFIEIKNKVKEIDEIEISETKDKIKKGAVIGKVKKTDSQYTKELKEKIKEIDEIDILLKISDSDNDNDKEIDDKKDSDYKKSLFICKHFLWHEKQNTSCNGNCNFKLINYIHNEYNIQKVEHLGTKNQTINKYWINLYPTDKNPTTSSTSKTDIYLIFETNQGIKNYHLSLKNIDAQLATPTFVDIYTLIMHGMNIFLEKIKNRAINTELAETAKKENEILNQISDIADKILSDIQTDKYGWEKTRRKYIDNLKEQIGITDEKTNEYKTNVSVAILLELFIQKFKDEFPTQNNIEDSIKNHINSQDPEKQNIVSDIIKASASDFKLSFSDKISEAAETDIIRKHILGLKTLINIDNLKEEIKILIKKFKKEENSKFELTRLDPDVEAKYNEAFASIKRLIKNDKQLEKEIKASKEKEYKIAFELKDTNSKANEKFIEFFKDSNEDIFNVLEKFNETNNSQEEIGKTIKDIINKNKKIIKREIIKEAITGMYKFTGNKKFPTPNQNVATHIFEFNKSNANHLKITPIDDENSLENFVDSLNLDHEDTFKFSVKGSEGKSFVTLRINAILNAIKKEKKKNEEQLKKEKKKGEEIDISSFNGLNYEYDIYTEGFVTDLFDKVKENIDNVFDDFKIKILKTTMLLRGKASKLLNLFGLEVKVDKNMKLPKWIVDKL